MAESTGLPAEGLSREEVLGRLKALRGEDARWREGRTFSLVYHASDGVEALLRDAYSLYLSENALSPLAFPSLKQMEREVVRIAADLFHGGPDSAGTLTSGGSESILLAVKTARDRAGIAAPEMVLPLSAHPAFEKAAHYFGVKAVHAPLGADYRVDLAAVGERITQRTVLLVGSTPAYPHGVVDDIEGLAALATERGVPLHVDACLGGFLLPFARKLGAPVPRFDFELPGVTSLSADLHKYGYAAKGASVLLHKDRAHRRHQFFTYSGWPGGVYVSPSMTGTRPGGAIAAAWAVLHHLGESGYLRLASGVLETARRLREGIASVPGLRLWGDPKFSVFSFGSAELDVYALGDAMDARGWKLDRQHAPPALHLMVTPAHAGIVERFLADLRDCASRLARGEPAPDGSAAMYGMLGAATDRTVVDGMLLELMDELYP
jgi:sphinganine-1-phosphate aldolase